LHLSCSFSLYANNFFIDLFNWNNAVKITLVYRVNAKICFVAGAYIWNRLYHFGICIAGYYIGMGVNTNDAVVSLLICYSYNSSRAHSSHAHFL
jgi:hypothetical protein